MSAVPPTRPGRTHPGAGRHLTAVPADEYFDPQWTSTAKLPDPSPLVDNLARGAVEVLSGVRDLEQMGRWMTEGVYKHLLRRSILAARGRAVRRVAVARPVVHIAARRITTPADGVVEATVIIHGHLRARAIAMRLEGFDARWRATALHIL